MANLIALIYNWWHLYVRLYDGDHHREAICAGFLEKRSAAPSPLRSDSSRPALLSGVARLTRHSGQRTVKISVQHEKSDLITAAITQISNTLTRIHTIAEHWTDQQRWTLLLSHIFRRWLGGKWLGQLPPDAVTILSG
jgi:hypothetical protein